MYAGKTCSKLWFLLHISLCYMCGYVVIGYDDDELWMKHENKRNCYTFPWRYILSLFYLLVLKKNAFAYITEDTTIIFELC